MKRIMDFRRELFVIVMEGILDPIKEEEQSAKNIVKIKRDRCNKNILYGRWKIMFGKKKNNINKVVVSSKEELKTAIKRKEPYIEVQGDLAKKMKWMGKLSSVKIAAIIALLTSLAAVPGGGVLTVSALTAGGVVEAAEVNVAIYVISILGIATIIGIFRGYNVEVETGKVSLRLKAGA